MKKLTKKEEYMRTFTGKKFHIFNPNEDEIDIKDISHSLSMTCRFNAHTPCFYSVGSHSLIGTKLISKPFKKDFFCHDFSEAFSGDLISPIKRRSPEFRKMEKKIEKLIAKKYDLVYPMLKEVKEIDNLMFRMEFVYLMGGKKEKNEVFPLTKKEFMKEVNKPYRQVEKELLKMFNKVNNI